MGDEFQREWQALHAAPFLFVGGVVAVGLFAWTVLHFLYKHRLAGLKDELDRERRENEKLRRHALQTTDAQPSSRPLAPPTSESSLSLVETPPPVFVGERVTPRVLVGFYEDRTEHRGDQLAQPYFQKWMRVRGMVTHVKQEPHAGWTVALEANDGTTIVLWFEGGNDGRQIEMLDRGDSVSAQGWIWRIAHGALSLRDCRLVD